MQKKTEVKIRIFACKNHSPCLRPCHVQKKETRTFEKMPQKRKTHKETKEEKEENNAAAAPQSSSYSLVLNSPPCVESFANNGEGDDDGERVDMEPQDPDHAVQSGQHI